MARVEWKWQSSTTVWWTYVAGTSKPRMVWAAAPTTAYERCERWMGHAAAASTDLSAAESGYVWIIFGLLIFVMFGAIEHVTRHLMRIMTGCIEEGKALIWITSTQIRCTGDP